jgi:hypothetical protein
VICSYVDIDERRRARESAGRPGRAHARHPRLGAGGHRHGGRQRHRVDEPLGPPHVRRRTGRLRRRADQHRGHARADHPLRRDRLPAAPGRRPGRDLRVPAAGATGASSGWSATPCSPGGGAPAARPADLRPAGHRAPAPGRGAHRAGAGFAAAHDRDRAAGHCAVRRRSCRCCSSTRWRPCSSARNRRAHAGPPPEECCADRGAAAAGLAGRQARRQADGRTAQVHEWRERAGPTERVWDVRIVPPGRTTRRAPQLLLVASDVTEQRAAEQARFEAAIAQREMLVREVHHRIKNNLQGVAGLLQQNAARRPEVAAVLIRGRGPGAGHRPGLRPAGRRWRAAARGPLLRGHHAQSVQRTFGRTIIVRGSGGRICRHHVLPEPESIPVALTVNELLTNAIKHRQGGDVRCRWLRRATTVHIPSLPTWYAAAGLRPRPGARWRLGPGPGAGAAAAAQRHLHAHPAGDEGGRGAGIARAQRPPAAAGRSRHNPAP